MVPKIEKNFWFKIGYSIGVLLVYAVAVYLLFPVMGTAAIILVILPICVTAWLFGAVGGFAVGVLYVPVNIILIMSRTGSGWTFMLSDQGAIMGAFAQPILGAIVGSIRDVSVELERLNEAKDEFLSVVTHDLKSPLIPVESYADLLLEEKGGPLTGQQKKFVETIKRQSKKMRSMIDLILDYTRVEFGKVRLNPEVFLFNDLVVECLEEIKPDAALKKQQLKADLPAHGIEVKADRAMIGRVISNLLANAVKYTQEGGRITAALKKEAGQLVFSVTDNGQGIAPENLPPIFDKFYVVNQAVARENRSLGLGLHIAHDFVAAHGGRIRAESEGQGKGSRFSFTLPL